MKQSEKLDLILKFLYEKKFDRKYYEISKALSEYGINVKSDEEYALGKRLEQD